jgi:glycine/D-amino acid oxidase-like deaminating enzyme
VGAGAFGAISALELANRGFAVTILDRSAAPHPEASSTDISKMLRMDYGSDVFYHELAEASLDVWDEWNRDWARPLYHEDGFLILAPGPMRPGGFEYESHRVLTERGYTPQRVDSSYLARHHPEWSADRYPDGYMSPRGGWAESGAVVATLLQQCEHAGVQTITGAFSRLLSQGSKVRGALVSIDDNEQAVEADSVVLCAGAWTPSLTPWLSEVLRAVAQPVIHFEVDRTESFRSSAFPPFSADISGSGWYGFPVLDDGRFKLGHHSDGVVVDPSQRGSVQPAHIERARNFLRESIPSIADAPVVGTRICLYCDSVDGDLLLDRDPEREGLVVATGGSGHGFKFTPMIGKIVADAVEGRANRWQSRFCWRTGGSAAVEEARHQTIKHQELP